MKLQYDLSLDQLWDHTSESIVPNDLFDFWQLQKEKLARVPLDFDLKKIQYPSKDISVYLLSFKSINGDLIYGYYAHPNEFDEGNVKVLLQYHGYNWAMDGDLLSVVNAAYQGFHSYKMLVRGQQMSEDSTPSFGNPIGYLSKGIHNLEDYYYRYVYLDVVQSIDVVYSILKDFKNIKFFASGGSQGGALALVAAALSNVPLSGVISTHPFLSDFRRSVRIVPEGPYHEISEYLRRNSHIDREVVFANLDYFDVTNLATLVSCPVLLGIGLVDDIVAPSTTFGIYNRLNSRKYIEVYPEYSHEVIPDFDLKAAGFMYNLIEDENFDWKTHPLKNL